MTTKQRVDLVAFLMAATRLRRNLGHEVWVEAMGDSPGVVIMWNPEYLAYSATWGCGRVAATDVARLAA